MKFSKDAADTIGWDMGADEVRTDYSGRAMYGNTCFAIVTEQTEWSLLKELIDLRDSESYDGQEQEFIEFLVDREPRSDSMGLSRVYYWPSAEIEAGW